MADDVTALENVSLDREVVALAAGPAAVATLWEVCQIPDYRNISAQNHAELIATLYKFLLGPEEHIPEDWFARQVAFADRTDGDIDTLANRIAHIRTWTFVSNRPGWLKDPDHWQGRTRAIEDSLSDALHERLTQRFVDRRTSALMKRMRDKEEFAADIAEDGAIHVESHYVGRLKGFCFSPDGKAEGIHGKAARNAAAQVLAKELSMRARRVASAKSDALKLARNGRVLWRDEEIARLEPGEDGLKPQIVIVADEHLQSADKEKVQERLNAWLHDMTAERLKPLVEIATAADISGLARGIAFRMTESFGALKRETVAQEMKSLDQTARAQLRKYGVRFGAFNIYCPLLLKPAAAELTLTLWALKHAAEHGLVLDELPEPPRAGLTSFAADSRLPEPFYRAYGFHLCGPRAVRIDMLERLADLIRPLLAWRPAGDGSAVPPKGSTADGGFTATPEMMSLLGCSPEELGHVLRALGFRLERRPLRQARSAATPAQSPAPAAAVAEPSASSAEVLDAGSVSPAVADDQGQEADRPVDTAMAMPAPDVAPTEQPAAADVVSTGIEAVAKPEIDTHSAEPQSAEAEFEEIWRPKRRREHGRAEERRGKSGRRMVRVEDTQRKDGEPRPDQGNAHASKDRPSTGRRRSDRTDTAPHRREDHRRAAPRTGSSGPQKRGGVDPDSPFAALSALKLALEKRAQDPSSS
jgi:ATP-dependent RNA helicase SUPV3L1/SUV3